MTTPPATNEPITPGHIMQVGLGFWASKTLLSAVELELFTELAKGGCTAAQLQTRLGLHPRAVLDFLDALVALGFLERDDNVYRNTPATDLFLDKAKPSYAGGMLEMANMRLFGFWNGLTQALRTGKPQNETKGGDASFFAALYAEPARLKEFLKGMTGLSHPANRAIAERFPWASHQSFVDVGTAQGDLAVQVAKAHPHLTGIGFDLPAVGAIFGENVASQSLAARVRFEAGDFFYRPLPKADVVMMGHILHDWDLEEKKILIRKAFEAIPPNGALIVYESIIDDARQRNTFGLLMSLNMLVETDGGFDYTGADCIGWMKEIGFREAHVEHLVGPDSMVVGIK
jgi:SAM-dependent methyltransferase